jgi:hypothetical protein
VDTHVKVLAILYLVFAGLIALFGLGAWFLADATSGMVASLDGAAFVTPLIRLGGIAASLFFFLWAVPGFVIGVGLLKLRPWARIPGIVLSALSLMHVPFGTALGLYGLWILLHRDTERLFAARA